jgi:hypothetical protein
MPRSDAEEQFREIELEENENREAYTESEREKTFKANTRVISEVKKAGGILPQSAAKIGRGRPTTYGKPKEEIAKDLGISRDTIERAEKHVETAEQFPFMQTGSWRQSHVLAVREQLEAWSHAEL